MGKTSIGSFEQLCLLALIHLKDNAYGKTIQEEISTRAGFDVSLGQIYVALERLEAKGFVSSVFGESTPTRGGKPKRFFQLTGLGDRALNDSIAALDRMRFGILVPASVQTR